MKHIFIVVLLAALLISGCTLQESYGAPDTSEDPIPVVSPAEDDLNRSPNGPDEEGSDTTGEPEEEPEEVPVPFDFLVSPASEIIEGLAYMSSPIRGAKVTIYDSNLPNAPRPYRNGFHEGLDYFGARGTTILSVAAGTIIRVDYNFVEMTLEEYDKAIRVSAQAEITPEDILDRLRGRQVWVEHEHGIVTRYCHLESIEPGLVVGETIEAGQVVGTMGNSGTKSAIVGRVLSTASSPHLHFEMWQGDVYLGKERTHTEVRTIYSKIFDN